METSATTSQAHTWGAVLHLSSLTQFMIPLGNIIVPLVIWSSLKHRYDAVDAHGKSVLNFQISMTLYTLLSGMVLGGYILYHLGTGQFDIEQLSCFEYRVVKDGTLFPHWFWWVAGAIGLAVLVKITELLLVVYGAIKASNHQVFHYPLSIRFFK